MDNLFTPEVIESFLKLLATATDGGITAVIFWLIIPLMTTLLIGVFWTVCVVKVVSKVSDLLKTISNNAKEAKLEVERIRKSPVASKLGDKAIDSSVEQSLLQFLLQVAGDDNKYFHRCHLDKLKKAWDEYGREK